MCEKCRNKAAALYQAAAAGSDVARAEAEREAGVQREVHEYAIHGERAALLLGTPPWRDPRMGWALWVEPNDGARPPIVLAEFPTVAAGRVAAMFLDGMANTIIAAVQHHARRADERIAEARHRFCPPERD